MISYETVDHIDHEAVVLSIDRCHNSVTVRINDGDECGSCPASSLCRANGNPTNDIVIYMRNTDAYKKNDIVTIRGTEQMHRKAITIATVIPSIAMIAVMVIVYLSTANQLAAAIAGLGTMIVFFLLLWGARNKIAHEFSFEIVGTPKRNNK